MVIATSRPKILRNVLTKASIALLEGVQIQDFISKYGKS
jgi:hypothetical protein